MKIPPGYIHGLLRLVEEQDDKRLKCVIVRVIFLDIFDMIGKFEIFEEKSKVGKILRYAKFLKIVRDKAETLTKEEGHEFMSEHEKKILNDHLEKIGTL